MDCAPAHIFGGEEIAWSWSGADRCGICSKVITQSFLLDHVYFGIVLFHSDQSGGRPIHGDSAMLLLLPQGGLWTGSSTSSGRKALCTICESADHLAKKAERGFVRKPWWTKLGQCLTWKVPGNRTRWDVLSEETHSTSPHQASTRLRRKGSSLRRCRWWSFWGEKALNDLIHMFWSWIKTKKIV